MSSLAEQYDDAPEIESDPALEETLALERPMGDAELDALASELLGRMAEDDVQVARYGQALTLEIERITRRYNQLLIPLVSRRNRYEAAVCELARRADFGPKKKSRAVGNGTYGLRTTPERVEVTDAALALAWAKQHHPSAVKVVTTEKLEHRAIAPAVLARVRGTGELPDGFEVHAETQTPFARVETGGAGA